MPAVFDRRYVKRLDGPNVKKGKNKRDLAEQVMPTSSRSNQPTAATEWS
jgi:myo-inositol-1-phosphate synthase